MSLRPQSVPSVPEETARIARAAFPKGNLYLQMRDEIGVLFNDADFASLFPTRGQPAYAPWRLALITIFQFIENLSDRETAEAVRARIDWKYALSLELENSGFDSTVLCEFRARLLSTNSGQLLLDKLLDWCRERKMLKVRGRQRTDSTHVLAAVTGTNRLECILEGTKCTTSKRARRTVTILPQPQYQMLKAARKREETDQYKEEYHRRAGAEGTISQAVRGFGARRSRYIGTAKTQLQNVMTATAMNVVRISNWLNEKTLAKARRPLFVRVMSQRTV